ncbi:MAG: choice-of-anchor Q domain-containing protein [Myxococcota bacterium]|nr:choice-of-anchor Q domain-containing protein [Myxococcota bacterium]
MLRRELLLRVDLFVNAHDMADMRPDPHGAGSGIAPAEVDALLGALGLDFHIHAGAESLIDRGTDVAAPTADRDGVVRPQGGAADIGPHEWTADP